VIIAGLCIIEKRDHTLWIAERLRDLFAEAGLPFIFKASFDKANRSSLTSYRGPGLEKGLQILSQVKEKVGVPILTDIHESPQAAGAEVADVLQIPRFCAPNGLLLAAGRTGRGERQKGPVLVRKICAMWRGKSLRRGNENILLTERGARFRLSRLVVDFRSPLIMASAGCGVLRRYALGAGAADSEHTRGRREFSFLASAQRRSGRRSFFSRCTDG
jgi:2-dehydro-3-deoxyphosphooctonate aldolase (KDO 8-P synthase)